MHELQRFRGTERKSGQELHGLMRTLLRNDPVARGRGEAAVTESIDALLAEGVPFSPEFAAFSGYAQIAALYAGVLLKLAGASVAAVRTELLRRDEASLEALIPILQHRLRPEPSFGEHPPVGDVSTAGAPVRPAVTSAVEMIPPTPREAPLPITSNPASSAVGAQAGGPHEYLRGLITDDIARLIRAWRAPSARAGVAGAPAGSASAAAQIDAFVRIEISEGIALELRGSRADELADRGRRAEVIRQLAAQLDRFYGG